MVVFVILEIARINELRAMADMLQKQLEGSMHGPGGGGSSALGPRPSLASGGVGGRDNNGGGSVVLVSNLNEQVFVNYCIFLYLIVITLFCRPKLHLFLLYFSILFYFSISI